MDVNYEKSPNKVSLNLNARSKDGWTIYMIACKEGQTEIVKLQWDIIGDFPTLCYPNQLCM